MYQEVDTMSIGTRALRAWQGTLVALALAVLAVAGLRLAAHAQAAAVPKFTFGPETAVSIPGFDNIPDEQMSILKQSDGTYRGWVGGQINGLHGRTGVFTASTLPAPLSAGSLVFGPRMRDVGAYDTTYAAPGSVLAYPEGGSTLYMVYEGESNVYGGAHARGSTWATIGLAKSTDNGTTWTRLSLDSGIIRSPEAKPANPPGRGLHGNGVPSAIIADGYMYVFYTFFGDRSNPKNAQIQEARAPLTDLTHFKKVSGGDFTADALGGDGDAILPLAQGSGNHCLRANRQPGVSKNTFLHAYLLSMVCEYGSSDGTRLGPRWAFATSTDLKTWSAPVAAPEPSPESVGAEGTIFDWHATLISPDASSQQTTSQTGYIYYAKGVVTVPKSMYYRSFTISTK
jgi:hypothetical protein